MRQRKIHAGNVNSTPVAATTQGGNRKMTDEQKNLRDRAVHAIGTLAIARSWSDGTKYPKLACECEAARVALFDLLEDWRAHLGEPIDIKPAVKAQWLRELADQIEEDDDHD